MTEGCFWVSFRANSVVEQSGPLNEPAAYAPHILCG